MKRERKYSAHEALIKLRRYCAYQERCHREVKQKLWDWGMYENESGQIVVQLIEEGFLNEERYAKAIAGGKFRTKGWGKNKIAAALKSKGIVSNLISSSMNEIDSADYRKKLELLISKKTASLKGEHPITLKQKVARFALGKGYESDLVWEIINSMNE